MIHAEPSNLLVARVKKNSHPPLLGAIRWDGQSGFNPGDVGSEEERALGPHKWHGRLPFWASQPTEDSCNLRGCTQKVMDREIAYAKHAGIDYWAFCWYSKGSYLAELRRLYQRSRRRMDVKCCAILATGKNFSEKDGDELVEDMKKANYQRVLGDRPLLFSFNCTDPGIFAGLRRRCAQKRLKTPFITIMDWHAPAAAEQCDKLGGDAISIYTTLPPGKGAAPYAAYAAAERVRWEDWRKTGKQVIPWTTVGWDPRPRIETDPPYKFAPPYQANYCMSTGPKFAAQLRRCVKWVGKHPSSCQANAILCYSWNEYSEGGTICPKLSGNREHLDAIREVTAGLRRTRR